MLSICIAPTHNDNILKTSQMIIVIYRLALIRLTTNVISIYR